MTRGQATSTSDGQSIGRQARTLNRPLVTAWPQPLNDPPKPHGSNDQDGDIQTRSSLHDFCITGTCASQTARQCKLLFPRNDMTEAARPPSIHQTNGGAERDRTADPLLAKQVLSQLSYSPNRVVPIRRRRVAQNKGVVGPGRFELPTSPLSGVRSNQLSYGPDFVQTRQPAHRPTKATSPKRLTIGAKLRKAKGRPSPCEAPPEALADRQAAARPNNVIPGKRNEGGGTRHTVMWFD
jgi:hypothetical protein